MSVLEQAVQRMQHWIRSNRMDEIDEIVAAYDPDAEISLRGQSIDISIEDVRENEHKVYHSLMNGDTEMMIDSTEKAVYDVLHEQFRQKGIDDPDVGGHYDDGLAVEWVDPTDEMVVDVGESVSHLIGEMVAVRGRVRQATDAITWFPVRSHVCPSCLTHFMDYIEHDPRHVAMGVTFEPNTCADDGCTYSSHFEVDFEESRVRDYRHVIVEQSPDADGTTPSQIPCWVFESGRVMRDYPEGESVTVVGRLRIDHESEPAEKFIEVSSIRCDRDQRSVEVTEEDEEEIREMVSEMDNAWQRAADNLAPHIYGTELAKKGLVSCIVGCGIDERGESNHVMLIGDPGTGKTDLAEAVREVVPDARKASMTHSSEVGLTAAAVQESVAGNDEWVIRAGAMSLASGGVLTAEELDKANFDLSSLNDALESGEVPINKAGKSALVNTDARMIATANPEDSEFDPDDDMDSQLDFSADALDRFSLIYPFVDDGADDERNKGILESVGSQYLDEEEMDDEHEQYVRDIDLEMMQKWMAMASEQDVKMTEAAHDEIGSAWQTLRAADGGVIDMDARRLAAVHRVAMSVARVRLGDEVTADDAQKAARHVAGMLGEWSFDVTGSSDDIDSSDNDDDEGRNRELGDDYDERKYELSSEDKRRIREEAHGNDFDPGIIAHNVGLPENQVRPVVEEFRADDDEGEADEGDDGESIGELMSQPRQSSDD